MDDTKITPERSPVVERVKALRAGYLHHARDKRLASMLRELVDNVEACREGLGSRRRALFLVGASGSGKSYALRHHFGLIPELQPWTNKYGETVRPLLSIEAPKPCTAKDFAIAILQAIGVPSSNKMTEGQLFATVKAQLRERGIVFLHVDEAQHLLRHASSRAVADVQDRLKSLMQIDDWPLHTIYSGVPQLAELLEGDPQLVNRSMVMRFIPLSMPSDRSIVMEVLTDIVVGRCGLKMSEGIQADDFLGRLCAAGGGCYGRIIEAVQAACSLVMQKEKDTVDVRAFAHGYQTNTGCLPGDNIFTAARWSEIDPANALTDLVHSGRRAAR